MNSTLEINDPISNLADDFLQPVEASDFKGQDATQEFAQLLKVPNFDDIFYSDNEYANKGDNLIDIMNLHEKVVSPQIDTQESTEDDPMTM